MFENLTAKYGISGKDLALVHNLLDAFLDLAHAHNIQFFLYAGSLLGWHRCSGILPWDDDIDMAITRTEAMRVINITQGWVRYQTNLTF